MRNAYDVADVTPNDHAILSRMLGDAEILCRTQDKLLAGQYRHLRGRISALLELTQLLDGAEGAR